MRKEIKREHRLWRRICALMVVFAILFSDAAPFLPAVTAAEEQLICGLTEHRHSDDCYEDILICGEEEAIPHYQSSFKIHQHTDDCRNAEGEIACGYVENEYYHTHNEYCRDADGCLVCGLEAKEPHKHTDGCYETDRILICENEDPGHAHSEKCYKSRRELTCDREEKDGHKHTDDCYTEKKTLVCEKAEEEGHRHSDDCYTETVVQVCGQEEDPGHHHTEDCWQDWTELTCDLAENEEHQHGEGCYTAHHDLVCGQEEYDGHQHSDACFETIRELTCDREEKEGHAHSDACYKKESVLTCGKKEEEGHRHSDACYTTYQDLVCGEEERPAHTHTDACYKEEEKLICDKPTSTHRHSDACFNDQGFAVCGKVEVPTFESSPENWTGGHTHTEECYERKLTCKLPEHVHTDQCRQSVSEDPAKTVDDPAKTSEDSAKISEGPAKIVDDPAKTSDAPAATVEDPETDKQPDQADKKSESTENRENEEEKDQEIGNSGSDTEEPEDEDPESDTEKPEDEDPESDTEKPEDEDPESVTKNPEGEDETTEEENPKEEDQKSPSDIVIASEAKTILEEISDPDSVTAPETDTNPETEPDSSPEGDTPEVITLEAKDAPVQIAVTFSSDAGIPEGTELVVTDPAGPELQPDEPMMKSVRSAKKGILRAQATEDAELPLADVSLTEWQAGDEIPEIVLYHRALEISLVSEGQEIEPAPGATVSVSVTLPDLEEGLAVEVRHETPNGFVLLESRTEGQTVIFETDGFSLFDFTSVAQKITSWTSDLLENTLFGTSSTQNADHSSINIDENTLPDGFSILEAFSTTQDSNLWLMIQRIKDLMLGKLESISLYAVENGELTALVKENIGLTDILRLSLSNYSSFALVRDSGLRRRIEDFGSVILSGLMPKNGVASASDVTEEYENPAWLKSVKDGEAAEELGSEDGGEEGEAVDDIHTLAAYDITITNDGEEYQPEENPVAVTISNDRFAEAMKMGSKLSVWHILDDGTAEEVTDFTVEGDTLSFNASGFSVYVVTETVLEKTLTASDGNTYRITATYDTTSGIPADAELVVTEAQVNNEQYRTYLEASATALNLPLSSMTYSKLFDISIVGPDGTEYQPDSSVTVKVELLEEEAQSVTDLKVVHFGEDESGATADQLEASTNGTTVTFNTTGFSLFSFSDFSLVDIIYNAIIGDRELYENDDIILTGQMPMLGSVEANRVEVPGLEALVAYDIKIYANPLYKALGITWQPSEDHVQVTIKSDALDVEAADIYHMESVESTAELVGEGIGVEDNSVTFEAESFSVYVVIDHEGGKVVNPRVEFHFINQASGDFITDNGSTVYFDKPYEFTNKANIKQTTQILKNEEALELIPDPGYNGGVFFYGWYVVTPGILEGTTNEYGINSENQKIYYTWPVGPQRITFETPIQIEETNVTIGGTVNWSIGSTSGSGNVDENGKVHVLLAPMFLNYHFANFMQYARTAGVGSTLIARKLLAFGSATSIELRLSDVYANSTDPVRVIFKGWEYNNGTEWVQVDTIDYTGKEIIQEGKDGTYISVTNDIDLYPVFIEARWIDFNVGASGNGASYIPACFLLAWEPDGSGVALGEFEGQSMLTQIEAPVRKGYKFGGWYANVTDFNSETGDFTTGMCITGTEITDGKVQVLSDINQTGTEDGNKAYEVSNGKLKLYKGLTRLSLYAKWIPDSSNITIVYWTENAEDSDFFSRSVKTVNTAELNDQLGTDLAPGSTITFEQLKSYRDGDVGILSPAYLDDVRAVADGEQIFFDLKEEPVDINDERFDSSKMISGEGTTIFNVYYTRKVFTLVFHIGRDGYISTSGEQRSPNQGSWMQMFYGDEIATSYDAAEGGKASGSRGNQEEATATMTFHDRSYTAEYETTPTNIKNYYIPNASENVYMIQAKYGAYIGDRWPSPSNPNFTFNCSSGNKTMYIWSAYYGSRYCSIANERGATDGQGDHPDINGIYNYMSAELCSNRDGTDVINSEFSGSFEGERLVHHFVAYFGDKGKASTSSNKHYHIYYEAINDTYDPVKLKEGEPFLGNAYNSYTGTTWSNYAHVNGTVLNGRYFYVADEFDVISNLDPQYQLASDLNGYELIYSCYNTPTTNNHHIYFFYTPKQYELTFKYENVEDRKTDLYYYTQSLSEAKKYTDPVKPGYEFLGWYTNEAGSGASFDFANTRMPSMNLLLYPVFRILQYRVEIDPNGGVIDHVNYSEAQQYGLNGSGHNTSQATYFTANFATSIIQYNVERAYIALSDKELDPNSGAYYGGTKYYYLNMQFTENSDGDWGLHTDLRNALYLTETELQSYYNYYCAVNAANAGYYTGVTTLSYQDFLSTYTSYPNVPYRHVSGESYSFMGWYQVDENGNEAYMPYNFNDPVYGPIKLRAKWRVNQGMYIKYNPYSFQINTEGQIENIIGEMSVWHDPANINDKLYADQSPTHVLQEPVNVTEGWVFRGWRVVKAGETKTYIDQQGEHSYTDWVPIQFDKNGNPIYYSPGDDFIVDSSYVSEIDPSIGRVINMQAYYEETQDSFRRPDITNLTLDANKEYGGFVNQTDSTLLPPLTVIANYIIDTTNHLDENNNPMQIIFGDFQSNLALHLFKYATNRTNDENEVLSQNFFTNKDGHLLIGFDEKVDPMHPSTEEAFIPSYAADTVLSVSRNDERTLYAMWEPMVYVTFVNQTAEDLEIHLSGTGTSTVVVVNLVTGEFDRKHATTTITVPKNDGIKDGIVKIVLPGAVAGEDFFTAETINEHLLYKMTVAGTYLDNLHGVGEEDVLAGDTATYTGSLVNGTDGVIVTYSEKEDPGVLFNVNEGTWMDSSEDYINAGDDIYFIQQATITTRGNNYEPVEPIREEKVFLGWTTYKDIAEHTDFSSTAAVMWGDVTITPDSGGVVLDKISNYLWNFDTPVEQILNKTLYAVWSDTVSVVFDVTRTGSNLYNWIGPDTETTTEKILHRFCRTTSNNKFITYTMLKGEKVPRPIDPTYSSREFLDWVPVTDYMDKPTGWATVDPIKFDFEQSVTEYTVLYTSWREKKGIQIYTFTIQNRVVDPISAEDEFEYVISTKDIYLRDINNTWDIRPSSYPFEPEGRVKTYLKNNEEYTVRITITRQNGTNNTVHNWNGYDVYVEVIDRNGEIVKDGHILNNAYGNEARENYKYTIQVAQTPKDGYTTNVTKSGTDQAVLTLAYDQFTFVSNRSYKKNDASVNSFAEGNNDYKKQYATVTFINSRKVNLALTKALTGISGDGSRDFEFSLVSAQGEETGITYPYTKTLAGNVTGSGRLSTVSDSNAFTLKSNETIVIELPPEKNILIRENEASYIPAWTTNDTGIVTISGADSAQAEIQLTQDGAMTVTNTRKTATVTVRKVVTQPGDPNSFSFTAALTSDTVPIADYPVYTDADNSENNITTDPDGLAVFSLFDGGMQTLQIPCGAKLVVKEINATNYTPSAEMVDDEDQPVADADGAANSFTVASVAGDGTITFTNIPKVYRSVTFDANGGVWTETSEDYVQVSGDQYEIDEINIVDNKYRPDSDPIKEGKAFIGWTNYEDIALQSDFSSDETVTFGTTSITPDSGSNVLAKIRESYLWDFDEEPPFDQPLYAVWSDTVTVTFDLIKSKVTDLHTWTDSSTEIPGNYVYYRANSASSNITYTMAKGDHVPKPSDPTTSNWKFLQWVTVTSRRNGTTNPVTINSELFDFDTLVITDQFISTSWMSELDIRTYTFTVRNEVDGGNAAEEFEYTIEAVSNMDYSGNYYMSSPRGFLPLTTHLKHNETYTFAITAVRYNQSNWNHNSLYLSIYNQEGRIVSSGHLLEYHRNDTTIDYESSDYQILLTMTQTTKENYTTTVNVSNDTVLDTDPGSYTFGTGNKNSSPTGTNSVQTNDTSFSFRSSGGGKTAFVGNKKNYDLGSGYPDVAETVIFRNVIKRNYICKFVDINGEEHPFETLNDALAYIRDHVAAADVNGTATIEMLVDYTMPVNDIVTINSGDKITLTTAAKSGGEYNYTGAGSKATITRGFDYDSTDSTGSMFASSGSLTFGSIILDGAGTQQQALTGGQGGIVRVESGTVTISQNAVLRNAVAAESVNGGAVYVGSNATLNMAGTISDCEAENGSAIYAISNSTVNITGTIWRNRAENGGAVKAESSSTINISGNAIISNNTATDGNGGGILSAGTVNMTGGTLTGNNAEVGAAIYMEHSGELHVSGGSIAGNTVATTGGGAIVLGSSGSGNAKAYFSGNPIIYDNTDGTDPQCNVALYGSNTGIIIVEEALSPTAKIGIWADPLKNGGDIFGSYTGNYDQNLSTFRNDRENDESGSPLRGEKADADGKIRWPGDEPEQEIYPAPTGISTRHLPFLLLLLFGILTLLLTGGTVNRSKVEKKRADTSTSIVATTAYTTVSTYEGKHAHYDQELPFQADYVPKHGAPAPTMSTTEPRALNEMPSAEPQRTNSTLPTANRSQEGMGLNKNHFPRSTPWKGGGSA